jgi:gas vesicle protein
MKASKILIALAAGAAAGAVLGILFAPDKGTETRRKISKRSSDIANSLRDNFNDFVDSVKENFSNAKAEVKESVEKGMSKFN